MCISCPIGCLVVRHAPVPPGKAESRAGGPAAAPEDKGAPGKASWRARVRPGGPAAAPEDEAAPGEASWRARARPGGPAAAPEDEVAPGKASWRARALSEVRRGRGRSRRRGESKGTLGRSLDEEGEPPPATIKEEKGRLVLPKRVLRAGHCSRATRKRHRVTRVRLLGLGRSWRSWRAQGSFLARAPRSPWCCSSWTWGALPAPAAVKVSVSRF